MRIRLSIAARNRMFSRAARRVRPQIDVVLERIASTELNNPTWPTVLLGVTDEYLPDRIDTIPNNEGALQLKTGFSVLENLARTNDAAILAGFIAQIRTAIRQCELTPNDYEELCAILDDINRGG